MITIGAQIKKIRKLKKVTLTELSRRSGVQIATLSRMEHGKMEGTVGSHFQIAKALGVDIVNIYQGVQEEEAQPVSSQETLETLSPPNEKVSQEILSRQPSTKRMLPVLIRLEPKGKTSSEKHTPGSERFLFVLEGTVTVHVREQAVTLKKNGSLYFNGSLAHTIENAGASRARVLSVLTPVAI